MLRGLNRTVLNFSISLYKVFFMLSFVSSSPPPKSPPPWGFSKLDVQNAAGFCPKFMQYLETQITKTLKNDGWIRPTSDNFKANLYL